MDFSDISRLHFSLEEKYWSKLIGSFEEFEDHQYSLGEGICLTRCSLFLQATALPVGSLTVKVLINPTQFLLIV